MEIDGGLAGRGAVGDCRGMDRTAFPFPAEWDAARTLASQQSAALRALRLPPELGLACPAPQTAASPAAAATFAIYPADPEPCWWGIRDIAEAYGSGTITPAALVDALIARIDRLDPQLHSFIHLDRDGARAAARDPHLPRGALYGVPVGIKDVIDVAGMATTCHSRLRLGHIAAADAPVVAQLRSAGAIIMGKLATHEFAIGGPSFDLPFPPARNPWHLAHHPGGSSSGAGAAVAAGLIPLAIGTDTAGSVRNPASACGIVGLKPTLGAIGTAGVFPLAWTLDHVGLLTRSAADAALACGALMPVGAAPDALRFGYVRHFHTDDLPADAEVAAALDRVADALGATPAVLPPLGDFALVNRVILQAEGWAVHADALRADARQFAQRTRSALLPGAFLDAEDYLTARRMQAVLTRAVDAAFERFDVLITASSMTPACRIDDEAAITTTYLQQARTVFNVTGHPALAMMAGLSSGGLPLSVQFAARRGEEAALLAAAAQWEALLGGPQRPPRSTAP